jgi:2,3-bisphosphoglycerate-independent phosphoglycerate mutase
VVDVLVVLDGASEPVRVRPTSLERARTPSLDRLARAGTLARVRTVPAGLPAGSEHAITTLLGWPPPAPVDRGALEAAARDIAVAPGEHAWRVDSVEPDGSRGCERRVAATAARLASLLPQHRVERLEGHRLLVCGPPPLPPLPGGVRAWPAGVLPPQLLDESTTLIAAAGAAAGIGRLMGARVVVPAGATGRSDTDLAGKAAASEEAVADGADRVVVHVAAPDEAAHARNRAEKVRAIARADRELIAPLERLVAKHGGTLTVCPDHGCDPRTGAHDAGPVPAVWWAPGEPEPPAPFSGPRPAGASGTRLTERAVAGLPVTNPVAAREVLFA